LSEVERDELIVFCTIIDTIKGKVLPSFKNVDTVDPKDYDDPEPRLQRAIPGVKFQFTYWLDNLRMCPDFRPLIDSLGVPWTTSGNEYVVFLFPVLVCGDTTTLYYTLWPFIGDGSCVYNMFPVKDGLIYNPLHEYGVPDQSPVFLFKKRLRDLIDDILSKRTLIITEANNEDISINEGIRLSPNPATDFLEISYSDANHTLNGVVDGVAIYNVFGEKVLSTSPRPSPFLEREYPPRLTSSATPQEGNLRLDVSSLPAGVYFVRVGDKVGKFIKFE